MPGIIESIFIKSIISLVRQWSDAVKVLAFEGHCRRKVCLGAVLHFSGALADQVGYRNRRTVVRPRARLMWHRRVLVCVDSAEGLYITNILGLVSGLGKPCHILCLPWSLVGFVCWVSIVMSIGRSSWGAGVLARGLIAET